MRRNGHPVVGFGESGTISSPAVALASPWPAVFATSVVSAVTGLVVEEIVKSVRRRKRKRR